MTAIVETFTTPNRKTKSGEPLRWRWRLMEKDGPVVERSQQSFASEAKAIADIEKNLRGFFNVALRRPGHPDVEWIS